MNSEEAFVAGLTGVGIVLLLLAPRVPAVGGTFVVVAVVLLIAIKWQPPTPPDRD